MRKVLITGASGFLGKKIYSTLSGKHEVIGVFGSKSEGLDPSLGVLRQLDITDRPNVEAVLDEFKPSFVIHTAAMVDVERCEADKKLAHTVNVGGTKNIADCCKKHNSKLVYISTDYIFGSEGSYTEESKPGPLNYYGKTKLEGENIVKETLSDYVIIRPTIMYGFNDPSDKETFVSACISRLKNKEVFRADDKRVKYPLLIDDIANAIMLLLEKGSNGIFNIATQKGFTKYQWAKKIAKRFGFPKELVEIKADTRKGKRPNNIRLTTEKIEKLGFKIHTLNEGLDILKAQIIKEGC